MMHGFGFGIGGFIGMVLVWVLLIVGAVWLIKQIFSGSANQTSGPDRGDDHAVDILDKRYARGDLNREEYELMKKDLQG